MGRLRELILERHGEIIRAWSTVASRSASAQGLSRNEVDNLMRAYLASLATEGRDFDAVGNQQRDSLESHLAARLRQGFDLADIIDEFAMLERCILDVYASVHPSAELNASELRQLATGRQTAAAAIKHMFREYALEDAQGEKRAMLRIQQVATQAMQEGAPPFQTRLVDVAAIILDVMKAASITIVLYDATRRELVACASAGAVREDIEPSVSAFGENTLAGKVAQQDHQPVSLLDVQTTDIEVSDTLRHSGLHAVLGVRLPLMRDLTGIMYIAVREVRAFDVREKRRFEALAERLALHLEAAHLHDALNKRNADLTREKALRERFVTVLAHDLRGPLTAARFASERLVRNPERLDTSRDLAVRILHNIDRTDQMIHDLLDANRIQAGHRLPLRLGSCDLRSIASEVIEELEQSHGPRFVLTTEPHVEGLWSAENLRRALWNLTVNALKYGAPDTPITLTIRRDVDHVNVSVHNLGPVISEADQLALRAPYHRTSSAQASNASGWGLGLTLVQGCAEAHGGKLDIVSDAKGTTFTLILPVDATPYQASPESQAAPPLH